MTTTAKHITDRPARERAKIALMEARTDIGHWLQLARRQREEIPSADFVPCAPNSDGIAWSEFVIAGIDGALVALKSETEEMLVAIFAARSALACVMQHAPGYDWNADPLHLTKITGDAFAKMDKATGKP